MTPTPPPHLDKIHRYCHHRARGDTRTARDIALGLRMSAEHVGTPEALATAYAVTQYLAWLDATSN